MRAVNVLLAIAVSLLLALSVFEGGLRLIGFSPPSTLNHFDAKLGWTKIPSYEITRGTSEFDVTFTTNSRGLRDDEDLSPAKPEGVYRVVVLGDSFALGYTVDREDLFVDQLEGWWNSEQRRVQVVNGGTEGWSTDQEVRWFLEEGASYEPDLVLLLPYENDIYWNGQSAYHRFPKPRFVPIRPGDAVDPAALVESRTLVDPGPGPLLPRTGIGRFLITGVLPLIAKPPATGLYAVPGTDVSIDREFTPLLTEPPDFPTRTGPPTGRSTPSATSRASSTSRAPTRARRCARTPTTGAGSTSTTSGTSRPRATAPSPSICTTSSTRAASSRRSTPPSPTARSRPPLRRTVRPPGSSSTACSGSRSRSATRAAIATSRSGAWRRRSAASWRSCSRSCSEAAS
jgi:hypothetical protein